MPRVKPILLSLLVCLAAPTSLAQDADPALRIGTREAPPFAMKTADGGWEGISISVLEALSERLGFDFTLVEADLAEMVNGVAAGRLDASIAAMTITVERERIVDFSHPFYQTGLGVAVAPVQHPGYRAVIDVLTSRQFLTTIGLLVGLLLAVGALVWAVERRKNPRQFENDAPHGLFSGFWWAAVTMSTVGYGDKTPITAIGRLLAMAWMLVALILTAVFTAQLTTGLTSSTLQSPINNTGDLRRVRTGYVEDSASLAPLRAVGVRPIGFPDVLSGLQAVADRQIEAFVHDAAILQWEVGRVNGAQMSSLQFAPQSYGIVLPPDTPFRETVNRALLDVVTSDDWQVIRRRFLGQ